MISFKANLRVLIRVLSMAWHLRRRVVSAFLSTRTTHQASLHSPLVCRFASAVPNLDDDGDATTLTTDDDLMIPPPDTIPPPKSLSPSSIMEFQKCPQSFLFQYLWGMRQPTTPILAKGTMCHAALEQVFDLEPPDRTLTNLQNLYRSEWSKQKQTKDEYKDLFEGDVTQEREWGLSGLELLENYMQLENPALVERPNPIQREIWVRSDLQVATDDDETTDDTFLVRGIVDRLDMVQMSNKQVFLRIVDYKSGKAPHFKYSPAMNAKIAEEAFFQLKIYALLLRESHRRKTSSTTKGLDVRILRLLHLTSDAGHGQYLDYDLGETREERNAILDDVHRALAQTWTDILALVATQDATQFVGCDRSFCYCHKCRPRFVPGSVWEP